MQTCSELGFAYSPSEWQQLKTTLTGNSEFEEEDANPDSMLMVRNGDFFDALMKLSREKHRRNGVNGGKDDGNTVAVGGADNLKVGLPDLVKMRFFQP